MKKQNLSITFPALIDVDGRGFSYVDDARISGVSTYKPNSKGIAELKSGLAGLINDGLDRIRHYRRRAIATKSGVVLIVERKHCSWQYSIIGPERDFASISYGDWDSLESAVQSARMHAETSYDGIAWESSL